MDVADLIPYLIIFLVLTLFATIAFYVVYSGLFQGVQIGAGQPPLKNATIAYFYSTGPYSNTGYYFTQVTSIAPKQKCLGIYYDNPEEVTDQSKLRWVVGCVLAEGDEEPDETLVKALQDNDYKIFKLPAISHAVKTSFPHKTFLSIFLGIYKVYPSLSYYIEENRLCARPCIEIYNDDVIEYMLPLAKQDEFYVPEARILEDEEAEEVEEEEGEVSGNVNSELLEGNASDLDDASDLQAESEISEMSTREEDQLASASPNSETDDNAHDSEPSPTPGPESEYSEPRTPSPGLESEEESQPSPCMDSSVNPEPEASCSDKENVCDNEPMKTKDNEEVVGKTSVTTSDGEKEKETHDTDAHIDEETKVEEPVSTEKVVAEEGKPVIVDESAKNGSQGVVAESLGGGEAQGIVKEAPGGLGYASSDSNTDSEGSFEKIKHGDVPKDL